MRVQGIFWEAKYKGRGGKLNTLHNALPHSIGATNGDLHHKGAAVCLFTIQLRLWHNALPQFRRMACFLLYYPRFPNLFTITNHQPLFEEI